MRPGLSRVAPPRRRPPRPVLRLSGLWLEQLGFAIGSRLQSTCQGGR
ncbi:SymE family type I addiction module toxin [Xanthomonas sp. WHRI 7945]